MVYILVVYLVSKGALWYGVGQGYISFRGYLVLTVADGKLHDHGVVSGNTCYCWLESIAMRRHQFPLVFGVKECHVISNVACNKALDIIRGSFLVPASVRALSEPRLVQAGQKRMASTIEHCIRMQ